MRELLRVERNDFRGAGPVAVFLILARYREGRNFYLTFVTVF